MNEYRPAIELAKRLAQPTQETARESTTLDGLKPILDQETEALLRREAAQKAAQKRKAQDERVRMVRRQPADKQRKILQAAVQRYHEQQ